VSVSPLFHPLAPPRQSSEGYRGFAPTAHPGLE
jgi:hypothetical protein